MTWQNPSAYEQYRAKKLAQQPAPQVPAKRRAADKDRPAARDTAKKAPSPSRQKRRVTDVDRATTRSMAADGYRTVAIAAALGLHPATVATLRRQMGISGRRGANIPGPRPRTLQRVREWLELRAEGKSWAAIGRQYGCKPENAYTLCQRWGEFSGSPQSLAADELWNRG